MEPGSERSILVNLQNLEGKTNTYISYGEVPLVEKHDFFLSSGVLKISPDSPHFHREGTYYIMVVPHFGYLALLRDDYYRFQLNWKLESSVSYLNANTPYEVAIESEQYSYLKHYVMDYESDIRISLLSGGA
jgi:hypothetical protein